MSKFLTPLVISLLYYNIDNQFFIEVLVTLSILVTVIVLNVHFRSSVTHTMPDWVKRVFLIILPKILFIRQPNHKIQIGNISYSYSTLLNKNKVNHMEEDAGNNHRSPSIFDFRLTRGSMRRAKAVSCSNSRSNTPVREKKYRLPEVIKAIDGINYVFEHMKQEDEEKVVKEQWKYVALVVDR